MQYIIKYDNTTGSSYSNTFDKNFPDLTRPYIADKFWQKSDCLHLNCTQCGGTGMRKDGLGTCVHMLSCNCPMCSPR